MHFKFPILCFKFTNKEQVHKSLVPQPSTPGKAEAQTHAHISVSVSLFLTLPVISWCRTRCATMVFWYLFFKYKPFLVFVFQSFLMAVAEGIL